MADRARPDDLEDDAVRIDDDPDAAEALDAPATVPSRRDTSSPDERERLVAEALAHAEAREAMYRRPLVDGNRWWKGALASLMLLLAAGFAVAPPRWLGETAPAAVSAATRQRGARLTLYLQARQVEAFRVVEGRLPRDLAEAGGALPGVRYLRSSDRVYQLVAVGADGDAIVWDSARPDPSFQREGARIPGVEGAS
jgi:hypothetical protein